MRKRKKLSYQRKERTRRDLLVKNDTWGYVSGEIVKPVEQGEGAALVQSQAAIKTWTVDDRKAKADLILATNPSDLTQIRSL